MTNITKAAQDALAALDEIHAGKRHPQLALAVAQQLRAALKDKAVEVARYRAIRDGLVYIEPYESGEIYVAGETGVYTKSGDEFDAAIDAIAASQKKG